MIAGLATDIAGKRIAYTYGIISCYALLESFYESSAAAFFEIVRENQSSEIYGFSNLREKVMTKSVSILGRFEVSSTSRFHSREDVASALASVYSQSRTRGLLTRVITERQANVRISTFRDTYDILSPICLMSRLASDVRSKSISSQLGFAESTEGICNAIEDLVERRNRLAHDLPDDDSLLGSADVGFHFDLVKSVAATIASHLRGALATNLITHSSRLINLTLISRIRSGEILGCSTPSTIGMKHLVIGTKTDENGTEFGWDIYSIARIEFQNRAIRRVIPAQHAQIGIQLARRRVPESARVFAHPAL